MESNEEALGLPIELENHIEKLCRFLESDDAQKAISQVIVSEEDGLAYIQRLFDRFCYFEEEDIIAFHPTVNKNTWLVDCRDMEELGRKLKKLVLEAMKIFNKDGNIAPRIAQAINSKGNNVEKMLEFISLKDFLLSLIKSYVFHHVMSSDGEIRVSTGFNEFYRGFWVKIADSRLFNFTQSNEEGVCFLIETFAVRDILVCWDSLSHQLISLAKDQDLTEIIRLLPEIDRCEEVSKEIAANIVRQYSKEKIELAVKYKAMLFMTKELKRFIDVINEADHTVTKESLDRLIEAKQKCQNYNLKVGQNDVHLEIDKKTGTNADVPQVTFSIGNHRRKSLASFLNWLKNFVSLGIAKAPIQTTTQNLISSPVEIVEKGITQVSRTCRTL